MSDQSQAPQQSSLSILGFLPALVVQYLTQKKNKPNEQRQLPEKQSLTSVVMFADISGFTKLTETVSKIGSEGAEVIAFAINRYMELLVKGIGRSGGDIFKFAGDAMIVIWPPPSAEGTRTTQKALANLCKQAIQSALDLQNKLNDTNIFEGIKLSVKIGFGIGDFNIIHVGGVFSRTEYLATGDPLVQAFSSEHCATEGGQTILSEQVYDLVENFFECQPVKDHPGHYFVYSIKKNQLKVKMKADALLIKNNLNQLQFQQMRNEILSYIPAALAPFIEIDEERWSSELKRLTIMFVNLGIDLSDAKTDQGLNVIQTVISTVQKCIYMHEGSLNKLLMDDKGSTLIVVFGLPPMAHQEDAQRAVLCGFTLIEELNKIKCSCSIGVATGLVFAGVVGTSGSRREYSVLGDSVNLAARLMQTACGEKHFKIVCCKETVRDAEHKIYFQFLRMVQLKGKQIETPLFVPHLRDSDKLRKTNPFNYFPLLTTHTNNYPVSSTYLHEPGILTQLDDREVKNNQMFFHGREEMQKQLSNSIEKFMKGTEKKTLFIVKGTLGIGKTLLVRKVLSRIEEKLQTNQYTGWKYGESPKILVCSLDPQTKSLLFNGIRPILQGFFSCYAKRVQMNCNESLLQQMVPLTNDNKNYYDIFLEMLGLKEIPYIKNFSEPLDKFKIKKIYKAIKTMIIIFLSNIFEHLPEKYEQGAKRKYSDFAKDRELDTRVNKFNVVSPFLLCFDDLHNYDKYTFKIISLILKKYERVFVLCNNFIELLSAIFRDQYQEPLIFKRSNKTQEEIVLQGMSLIEGCLDSNFIHTISMKGLEKIVNPEEFLRVLAFRIKYIQLIRLKFDILSLLSEQEFENKAQRNTRTVENSVQIDHKSNEFNYLMFTQNKEELLKTDIPLLLIHFIYLKTNGNPYMAINFFSKLVDQKLVEIIERKAIVTRNLLRILENEETILIDPPRCRIKVNGPLIDRLSCLEQLILKVASCIGEIFDIQTLNRINPFKQAASQKLQKLLDDLEQKEIIEILEVQECNMYFRFTLPFLRECIYQRMTFKQRRQTHISVAEAIQTLPQLLESEQANESKKLQFHWSLSEQKYKLEAETEENKEQITRPRRNIFSGLAHLQQQQQQSQIPFANIEKQEEPVVSSKAIRSIILKQISTKLGRTNNDCNTIIKEGYLEKKSDSNITWADRYCILDGKEFRYYYSERDAKRKDNPLSVITLKNLYYVEAMNERERYNKNFVFQINSTSWMKKNAEKGERKFYFAANTIEELEQWVIYLEFAKAKAVYDDFVGHYGKISFPIGTQMDYFDPVFRYDVDMQKRIQFSNKKDDTKQQIKSTQYLARQSRASKFSMALKSLRFTTGSEDISTAGNSGIVSDLPLLKQRLNEFLKRSMLVFYSHLFEMSLQREDEVTQFGQNTQCMKKMHQIFMINGTLLRVQKKISQDIEVSSPENDNQKIKMFNRDTNKRFSGASQRSDIRNLHQIEEEDDERQEPSPNQSSVIRFNMIDDIPNLLSEQLNDSRLNFDDLKRSTPIKLQKKPVLLTDEHLKQLSNHQKQTPKSSKKLQSSIQVVAPQGETDDELNVESHRNFKKQIPIVNTIPLSPLVIQSEIKKQVEAYMNSWMEQQQKQPSIIINSQVQTRFKTEENINSQSNSNSESNSELGNSKTNNTPIQKNTDKIQSRPQKNYFQSAAPTYLNIPLPKQDPSSLQQRVIQTSQVSKNEKNLTPINQRNNVQRLVPGKSLSPISGHEVKQNLSKTFFTKSERKKQF